jgi:hypothetical protein
LDGIISSYLWKKQCEYLKIDTKEIQNFKILFFKFKILSDMKEAEIYFSNEFSNAIDGEEITKRMIHYIFQLENILIKSFPYAINSMESFLLLIMNVNLTILIFRILKN